MTKEYEGILYVYKENSQQCDFCGEIDELRPYGPKGECICFDCMMKDESSAEKQLQKRLDGIGFTGKIIHVNIGPAPPDNEVADG